MKLPQSIERILRTEIDPAFEKRSRYILEELAKQKPKSILDAGCGRGFYVKTVSFFDFPQKITGIDIQDIYVKKAQKITRDDSRISVQKASIYALPFKDNSFDFIINSEVLEHLDNDVKAINELHRVLKKDGVIVITVPNNNFPFLWDPLNWLLMRLFNSHIPKHIWWLAGIWADHERLYTKKEIVSLVEKKFAIKKQYSVVRACWPFSHFLLYGVGKNIVERFGGGAFDRFSMEKDKPLSRVLAYCMSLPTRFFDTNTSFEPSVNHVLICQKK